MTVVTRLPGERRENAGVEDENFDLEFLRRKKREARRTVFLRRSGAAERSE